MFVEQVKRTMAAFAVISVSINTALDDAIASVYEGKALRISPTVQLVADVGVTTEEVSTKLGVKPGGIGGTLVFKIESYYGFASKSIWEWLKIKGSEA